MVEEDKPSNKKKGKLLFEYSSRHITWKATDKGVVKENIHFQVKRESFLPYKHISSIVYEEEKNYKIVIIGIIVLVFLILLKNSNISFFRQSEEFNNIVFVLIIITLIVISIGLFYRKTYYNFTGAGIDKKIWRMETKGMTIHDELKDFVETVKKKL